MKRLTIEARPNWQETVEADGVLWTTTENGPYWNEAMKQPVYYSFTAEEQKQLEDAANDIHSICISSLVWLFEEASEEERNQWFEYFGINESYRDMIMKSWNEKDEWGLYGRFDFIMTKEGPKLLEYNADTPTTLIETAITQWNWFDENVKAGKLPENVGQFNELHEALIRHWGDMKESNNLPSKVHFAAFSQLDDMATVVYMAETAKEADVDVEVLPIEQLGWDGKTFVNMKAEPVDAIFKLYPWEWMAEDQFGAYVPYAHTRWIEPSWKMMLSNKAILALLWKRCPNHPNLVPAYLNEMEVDAQPGEKWVTKPLLSREGSNVTIWECQDDGSMKSVLATDGLYDEGFNVYQKYIEWESIDGCYPMLGVWMVGDDAVALGIREDDGPVTQNNSRFIPHVFEA